MRIGRAVSGIALGLTASALFSAGGCGAKTGLPVPRSDAGLFDAGPACGDFVIPQEPAPLDVFIAMDRSGSMEDLTAEGIQKLDAVRNALTEFVNNPDSAGIGVTLSFFPVVHAEVPELCSSDSACGAKDACKSFTMCFPSFLPCATSADCAVGETCATVGFCDGMQSPCSPGVQPCSSGSICGKAGWCENRNECGELAYQPKQAPAILPDGAEAIVNSLAEQTADGGTPTLPALAGAIDAARARLKQAPQEKAIVLLATDGFPTLCDPAIVTPFKQQSSDGIPAVVATADAGHQDGIQTFVIGVFAPDESVDAQLNLNAIATAGGTDAAYVITTNEQVTEKFVAALNEIRNSATACNYVLPRPNGVPLDAKKLKIRITNGAKAHWLDAKSSLAACDPVKGGFVFDKDPNGTEPPSIIQLCPVSCAELDADESLRLEGVVECEDG